MTDASSLAPIPRTIHQIWVGPDPVPDEFQPYIKSWKKHHPGWDHILWTEKNLLDDPVRTEVLDRLRSPVERSDMLRLELLYRFGGVYVDTDLECLRPLDDVIGDATFVATYFKPGRVTNTFVAAGPRHPLLEQALAEIKPRQVYGFDKEVAGPPFLARLCAQYEDVAYLEPAVLFPDGDEERANAVAIHHMSRTWKDAAGLREAMLRAEQRLAKTKTKLDEERKRHAATRQKLEKVQQKLEKRSPGLPTPTEGAPDADAEAGEDAPNEPEPAPAHRGRLRLLRRSG